MPSTGFVIATAQTTDTLTSTTWTNAANVLVNDDTEATESIVAKNTPATGTASGGNMNLTTFGFDSSIPSGVSILKVEIQVRWRMNSASGIGILENYWVVSGTASGTIGTNSAEPTTLTTTTFNVTAERSWVRSDLLNANFTVRMRGRNGNSTTDPSYRFAWAKVNVTYSVLITQAGDTAAAQPADADKHVTVGNASTTPSAQPLVVTKPIRKTLGVATVTAAAQLLDANRGVAATRATETDTAQPVTVFQDPTHHVTLTAATGTTAAQAFHVEKHAAVTPALATDTARPADADKHLTVATATSANTTGGASAGGTKTIGTVAETDAAQPLNVDKLKTLGPALAANAALLLAEDKHLTPSFPTVTAAAMTLAVGTHKDIGPAAQPNAALALATRRFATVAIATQTSAATHLVRAALLTPALTVGSAVTLETGPRIIGKTRLSFRQSGDVSLLIRAPRPRSRR